MLVADEGGPDAFHAVRRCKEDVEKEMNKGSRKRMYAAPDRAALRDHFVVDNSVPDHPVYTASEMEDELKRKLSQRY